MVFLYNIIFCIYLHACYSFRGAFKTPIRINHKVVELQSQTTTQEERESFANESNNKFDDTIDVVNGTIPTFETYNETIVEESPELALAKAIVMHELKLANKLNELEDTLRAERLSLLRVKDRISESGKSAYFIVQAQVNDFLVYMHD
jgi:hypothetical protein